MKGKRWILGLQNQLKKLQAKIWLAFFWLIFTIGFWFFSYYFLGWEILFWQEFSEVEKERKLSFCLKNFEIRFSTLKLGIF